MLLEGTLQVGLEQGGIRWRLVLKMGGLTVHRFGLVSDLSRITNCMGIEPTSVLSQTGFHFALLIKTRIDFCEEPQASNC